MKCPKCGQWIVRLEDGTPDCGCYVEPTPDYPSLDNEVDGKDMEEMNRQILSRATKKLF